jgi:hypothetical protein
MVASGSAGCWFVNYCCSKIAEAEAAVSVNKCWELGACKPDHLTALSCPGCFLQLPCGSAAPSSANQKLGLTSGRVVYVRVSYTKQHVHVAAATGLQLPTALSQQPPLVQVPATGASRQRRRKMLTTSGTCNLADWTARKVVRQCARALGLARLSQPASNVAQLSKGACMQAAKHTTVARITPSPAANVGYSAPTAE